MNWKEKYFDNEIFSDDQLGEVTTIVDAVLKNQQEEFNKTLNSGRKMYELGKEETHKHYQEEIKKILKEYTDTSLGSCELAVDYILEDLQKLITK
jgi:hypothetical protein